ncbi:unnamed protein product [Adineta steineri]|uniref:G-protein coupled receptors family 1 profile domain-containing protein n=1 Tax=Adineta steineri TaxID=433720 RepID=A0A818WPV0_9BILA|nr:unnamed protein product [Adineta steineri]CAF1421033.1 unnamed protein product [Adineta steineri]CAF3728497.1 unnamed protein product [Adineta steineri]CAF3860299.1 unnamed protein product [Adineta steineri]
MSCNKSVNIFLLGLASGMTTDIRTSNQNQQILMTFAYAFSVTLMVTVSIISNIISIDTFRQKTIRTTTTGLCLLIYSCCSLFGIIMLECRLFQFIDSLTYLPFFIVCNLISGLTVVFTRLCLWLNGLIALQRALHSFEHNRFLNKIRSQTIVSKQICFIIIIVFLMHIHEFICRVTSPDPVAPNKFVCQILYSQELLMLNQIFSFTHLFVPFSLHIISTCLIIASISRRRAMLYQTTYWKQWFKQFRCHHHLFLAPILAMICTLPQLILSLKYSCVDVSLKWLLRLNTSANLIIYIPQSMTFFLFIYHSGSFWDTFKKQSILGKRFCSKQNTVAPIVKTAS